MPITLGNDLVDLGDAPNQSNNYRFLNRVFSPQEQQCIAKSHSMLWAFWSMKEAAFKAYQKQYLSHTFSPIGCQITSVSTQQNTISATVIIERATIECTAELFDENTAIHCIGLYSSDLPNDNKAQLTIHHKIDKINALTHRNQSHAVRVLAKQLFTELNFPHASIRRPLLDMGSYHKKAPPQIFIEGKVSDYELSLSHDGRYAAVIIGVKGS